MPALTLTDLATCNVVATMMAVDSFDITDDEKTVTINARSPIGRALASAAYDVERKRANVAEAMEALAASMTRTAASVRKGYSVNSLGEVQSGYHVDAYCGEYSAAGDHLRSMFFLAMKGA